MKVCASRSLVVSCLLGTVTTAQATLHVPGDFPMIDEAVAAASGGDTVLVAPGIYFESGIDTRGKAIRIASSGGPAVTAIQVPAGGTAIHVRSGEGPGTVIEGFTILDATEAGIYIQVASPVVRNCAFVNCSGTLGGGFALLGAPLFEDCSFIGCFSDQGGGGLRLSSSDATIRDCLFQGCSAGNEGNNNGRHGGALYCSGSGNVRVERCRFLGNRAGDGRPGAAGAPGSDGSLGNPPGNGQQGLLGGLGGAGGAVFIDCSTSCTALVVGCYFEGNRSGNGGRGGRGGDGGDGIAFQTGGNGGRGGTGGGAGSGGAVAFGGDAPELVNCTLVANSLGAPGAGGAGGAGGSGGFGAGDGSPGSSGATGTVGRGGGLYAFSTARIKNSIAWSNSPPQIGTDLQLFVEFSNVQNGFPGTGNIDVDPMLSGEHLLPGSPCIDAGEDALVPAGLDRDLDGEPRLFEVPLVAGASPGSVVDMGCDELVAPQLEPISCAPTGTLAASGTPRPGERLTFVVSPDESCLGPRARLLTAGMVVGTVDPLAPCGRPTAGGLLMLDPALPLRIHWVRKLEVDVPPDPTLVGYTFGVQGLSVAPRPLVPAPGCPSSGWTLLDTVQVVVGL